jgi:methionine sulfoxide reductase heme-binding subunit
MKRPKPFLRERSGAWSPEKIIAFVGVCLPPLWLLCRIWTDDLGPRPLTAMIHYTGDWAVRLLWITLAIMPAARLFKASKLLLARRILGVSTAIYALAHITLYITDQKFDLTVVATEIAMRIYLTIGFAALLGLTALLVTSTDAMVLRLGPRWNRLHRLAYPIAVLAAIHFLLQSKNDVWQPILMVGLLLWLFGYRIIRRMTGDVSLVKLMLLALICAPLTMLIEIGWYNLRSNVPVARILNANFDFSYIIHPAWWVLAATLAIPLVVWLWRMRPQRASARTTSSKPASGARRVQSAS